MRHRRAGAHAAAVILRYCATSGRAWWGWTAWDWAAVCGPSSQAFRAAQPLPTETTVRPFTIALGYLLGEFSDFQHLGNFNRLQLAQLVFSAADRGGDEAGQRGDGPLGLPQPDPRRWPLPATRHPRPGPADQPQPRLEDLGTAAFVALRAHPATSGRHPGALHALQQVVADLDHCDPPVRPGFNHAPGILGTDSSWAAWVQRWHDTSTLTPKVRALVGPRWPRPDGG